MEMVKVKWNAKSSMFKEGVIFYKGNVAFTVTKDGYGYAMVPKDRLENLQLGYQEIEVVSTPSAKEQPKEAPTETLKEAPAEASDEVGTDDAPTSSTRRKSSTFNKQTN